MLKLVVISASNLRNVDSTGKSDPYVKATFRGKEIKTDHIEDDLNPVWTEKHNNVLTWDVIGQALSSSDEIDVKVKDWEKVFHRKILGQVKIPLGVLLKTKDYTLQHTYPLLDKYDRVTTSKIVLRLQYKPSKVELETQYELQYKNEESEEEEEVEAETPGGTEQRKRKRRRTTLSKGRREWSTKVQHYKIRVQIHEGRQLPGVNISPIARITVKNQKHQTRVKHSTNNPVFNQTFSFNFHCSEAELFDNLLVFEVFNSKNFIVSNRLLGFFESDIGAIYEFPDHAFIRKWILLTGTGEQIDDETETKQSRVRGINGETAGYLKVTAMVLGPGDESPYVPQQDNEDEEDIESNCLMPVGLVRQPAKFVLKVYQAEDLPRMDTGLGRTILRWFLPGGGKEAAEEKAKLVDPYMVFSFCGKKVQTTTAFRQNNPTYNEMLTLPVMLPSMCEKIKLRFFDWDRGRIPEIIATSCLSLPEISGQDNEIGFRPKFGPSFVNFYGSPREFSLISTDYKDLDKGIGEGVAYRGRVLVELTTEQAGPSGESSISKLNDEDKIKIQPFLKQDHFKLFACFKDACMISKTDEVIEFEVSIGNFGNKLDETAISCNTPPTNPVYDGCHYHYLPWRHYKPCICLDCRWENIAFRIEPMNIINRMCENLEILINQVKAELAKNLEKGVKLLKSCLREIIANCSHTEFLEDPGVKSSLDYKLPLAKNSLDYKIQKLRKEEFKCIVEDAKSEEEKLELEGDQVNVNETIERMEGFLRRLKNLAIEPQISMPDVIIWMLCGQERVAYNRIPIQDVLYSTNESARGKFCGKTVELLMKYPGNQANGDKEHQNVPAMIRVELWVGLRAHQHEWSRREDQEGKFKVYAETYENETRGVAGWSSPGFGLRPHYSNATGDMELHKDMFVAPIGWRLSGGWKPILEKSVLYDRDYGLTIFTEEIYENQRRKLLGGGWNKESHWTEADGEPSEGPQDFPRPEGWQWISKEWIVDLDRAVDEEGWEYSETGTNYVKAVKPYHMVRRRRWICTRELVDPGAARKQEKMKKLAEEGWEYSLAFVKKFHVKKRTSDLVRRKRLLQEMVHEKDPTLKKADLPPRLKIKIKTSKAKKTRTKEKKSQESEELLGDEDREGHVSVIPRMFIVYNNPHKFQLWVYIYQARDLLALDDSGMSDPYVRVVFGNQSKKTEWKRQTTSPTWDETLIFSHVEIFEKVEDVVGNPPKVIMEVFDWDPGKHDFIGRCMMQPLVQTTSSASQPVLQWVGLHNGTKDAGQVLATAELFLDEGQKLPTAPTPKKTDTTKPRSKAVLPVRDLVRPDLQTVAVEILCWGVRNMKKYKFSQVSAPSVEFEWGEQTFQSEIGNLKKFPNFPKPILARKLVCLPAKPFTPALNIRVYDNRMFNKPLVGIHSISSITRYYSDERTSLSPLKRGQTIEESDGPLSPSPVRPVQQRVHKKGEEAFDWWSKYYSSMREGSDGTSTEIKRQDNLGDILVGVFSSGDDVDSGDHLDHYKRAGHDTLKIFPKELEKMEEFEGLEDFVETFNLKRGKSKDDDEDEDDNIGQLKASVWVYEIKEGQSTKQLPASVYANLPEIKWTWPIKCLVRAYVICGFDLQSQDPNGLADPYLVVSLGNKTFDDKSNCQHNTLKPVFGKMFEFRASIPTVKDLKVKVMDHDRGTFNEAIGETVIDLEQRLLSRLHASCGLPKTYSVSGPCAWRDSKRPKDILRDFCRVKGYKHWFYPKGRTPTELVVEKDSFPMSPDDAQAIRNSDYPDQQLSLLALHHLGLVPEHVETRSLYSSLQPQIEQGKVQMWVDIFPLTADANIKPAVKIEPREPLSYVLRVIIWDTTDVILQETSLAGEKMSDIYVKGWIDGINDKQSTDVHYRSLDGEGNFNWRMVFPFNFLHMDKKISISKKTKLTHLHKTEEKVEPKLKIQIWEDDKFSSDDFLGTRTLVLHKLPRPCRSARYCGTKYDPGVRKDESEDFVDLFQCKSIRGWWGCWKNDSLTGKPEGKVDMTIEVLTETEAEAKPAGKGRDEPNQHPNLPEPIRPKTSFLWFASPFKTMRFIVWRNYKWYIIGSIVFVFLALIIFLFVYSMPGYTVKKIFSA